MQKRHESKEKSRYLKQIPGFLLVREAGLELLAPCPILTF